MSSEVTVLVSDLDEWKRTLLTTESHLVAGDLTNQYKQLSTTVKYSPLTSLILNTRMKVEEYIEASKVEVEEDVS